MVNRIIAMALLTLMAIGLCGCGGPARTMRGTWVGVDEFSAGMPGGPAKLEVTSDELKLTGMGVVTMKYKVIKTDGNDVTLELAEGGLFKTLVATVDGDSLTFDHTKNQNPMVAGTKWKRT